MKITIYELLGMIKDNKAPRKIVFKEEVYTFDYEAYDYIATNGDGLFDYYATPRIIDDEVEILETTITYNQDNIENNKQDKIEKINIKDLAEPINESNIRFNFAEITDKINEIIDKLNKEEK